MKLQSTSKAKKKEMIPRGTKSFMFLQKYQEPLKHRDHNVSSSVSQKALKLCQSSSLALYDGPLAARSRKRTELTAAKHFVHSGVSLPCSSRLPSSPREQWKIHLFILLLVASTLLPPPSMRERKYSGPTLLRVER